MIYFNLFPRTGSAFFANLSQEVLKTSRLVIREPERYKDNINQVVVFRNPYDTISSVIDRTRHSAALRENNMYFADQVEKDIEYHNLEYLKFINLAIENFSNLHTGIFEDVMQDPVSFLKAAGNRFNIEISENPNAVEKAINLLKTKHTSEAARDFGHYIRPKDETRLLIEGNVDKAQCLKESFEKYKIFAGMVENDLN